MLMTLLACLPKQGALNASPERRYAIELFAEFDTRGVGVDLSGLERQEVHLRGEAVRVNTRTFTDGSHGDMLRFTRLEQASDAGGPWVADELSGLSVELRVFDSGEILRVGDAEHLAGAPRHGEVFDVLLPAISPMVPAVAPGEQSYRRTTWPFEVARERGWRNELVLLYTNQGVEDGPLGRTARLDYTGELAGEGSDRRMEAEVALDGSAEGTVWMRTTDAALLRHELDWTREVHATYGSGAELVQVQHFVATIQLVEGP